VHHYLDSANYKTKRSVFQGIVDKRIYEIDPEIESRVHGYFRDSIMLSKTEEYEGIYIANRQDVQLLVRNIVSEDEDGEWKEGDKFDAEEFKDAMAKQSVDKSGLNNIIGYMVQFKDQDMAFYYKDIHLKRNKKGRRCDRSGGKAPIIDMLNRVTRPKMYTEENTSVSMYSGSLCVVLEMLLRKSNDYTGKSNDYTGKSNYGREKTDKIYYLTPEQAIQSRITDYSASA
jgi:hypothetical protein